MKSLSFYVGLFSSLFFLAELFIILRLQITSAISIIFLHLVFAILGYLLSRPSGFSSLLELDSALLRNELLTQEFLQENLFLLSCLFFIIPSLALHIIGLLLFIPSLKHWLASKLFKSII